MVIGVMNWLVSSGVLQTFLDQWDTPSEEPSLTKVDLRAALNEYTATLVGRLDEDRLRQLGGALSQLQDVSSSAAAQSLAAQTSQSFHEIAALPPAGKTGGFDNTELIAVACVGLAIVYHILGSPDDLIAQKLVQAVNADPNTTEKLIGEPITNHIYRACANSECRPTWATSAGSSDQRMVPDGLRYFVAEGATPFQHLWIQQHIGPVTGLSTFTVGLTHYAAQHLGAKVRDQRCDLLIREKRRPTRQGKKCGELKFEIGADSPLSTPLTGEVKANPSHLGVFPIMALLQAPYGGDGPLPSPQYVDPPTGSWLFRVIPKVNWEGGRSIDYASEVGHLLTPEQYRLLLADVPVGTASVESITFWTDGGADNDKDVVVTIRILDQLGVPVDDAHLTVTLNSDNGGRWRFESQTDDSGTCHLGALDAPTGTYRVSVSEVRADGRIWGGPNEIPENTFRK
jgi:hypothetical protein